MGEVRLTERQQREREYYDEFSKTAAPAAVDFAPVLGQETRPWNSYWFAYGLARRHFRSPEQRLLDFGCGAGGSSVLYARIGYEVFGFDISPKNIEHAGALARRYGYGDRTHFTVGVAEVLDYPAEHFDVVVGIDILHHVNIPQALRECFRVLKPGGVAIFHEPVRVPLFDTLRETRFGRWLVPKEASFERHITHDERKLTAEELRGLREFDPDPLIRRFFLTARLDRFIRWPGHSGPSFLERFDHRLMRMAPPLGALGGVAVIQLRK